MNNEQTLNKSRARATTNQILGNITGHKINPKWRGVYDTLVDLRDTLLQSKSDLAESAKQDHQPMFSMHMADAASDQYETDFALSMVSSEQNALYEIEQALIRIRNGSYGICEVTGDEIESERLRAIPWTRFSANAQRQLEQDGAVSRPKLGQLANMFQSSSADEGDDEGEGE